MGDNVPNFTDWSTVWWTISQMHYEELFFRFADRLCGEVNWTACVLLHLGHGLVFEKCYNIIAF